MTIVELSQQKFSGISHVNERNVFALCRIVAKNDAGKEYATDKCDIFKQNVGDWDAGLSRTIFIKRIKERTSGSVCAWLFLLLRSNIDGHPEGLFSPNVS